MIFSLRHAVGNRERWRTTSTLTQASAEVLADEVSAIAGVTGVSVNVRTGSVVLTVDSVEAKTRTAAYFASLATKPLYYRQTRREAVAKLAASRAEQSPLKALRSALSERTHGSSSGHGHGAAKSGAHAGLDLINPAHIIDGAVSEIGRGLTHMPILSAVGRIRSLVSSALSSRRPGSRGSRALTDAHVTNTGELDFSSLARYLFLRPVLPMVVNIGNAVLGALPIIAEGIKNLFKGKLNVPVLDAAALIVSLLRRDFRTVGLLVVLLGLGEMLENYTRKKSLASLADELALKVDQVWVRRGQDGERVEAIALSELTLEDTVVVRSGSVIPADGIVVAGDASVNQATMTGEPLPVHRTAGGSVFAGTVVEDGEIDIRPTALSDKSRLSKIVRFIETSEAAKAGIQGKAEHLADAIVPYNFLLAGLVWLLTRDLTRTASVLLVDYSCALRLATPLAILTAMRVGTGKGVLVKGGRFLEALAETDTVVFDKTGTLTQASPVLSDIVPVHPDYDRKSVLKLAACLEEHFPHPVSRAIVRAAQTEGVYHDDEDHDTEVRYIVAHGICSSVNGKKCVLGSRHFVGDDEGVDLALAQPVVDHLAQEGKSVLYFAVGGELVGILGIEDPLRAEAIDTIRELRSRGIKRIVMLTGDDERTAATVVAKLGLDDYRAQVLPEEKAAHVEALVKTGAKVLMVGDGINDSPALSAAHVGVTLRDGTDIAQEVADVVLTGNNLLDLPVAIDLGRAALTRIKQNFAISVGLNTSFLAGGLTGVLTPAAGALLHNATTIGVCLNAMQPTLTDGTHRTLAERVTDIADNLHGTLERIRGTSSGAATHAA